MSNYLKQLKTRHRAIVGLILAIVGLVLAVEVLASAFPFSDDFNSYNLGDLNLQNDWATTNMIVVETDCLEEKCIEASIDTGGGNKTGELVETGVWSFYFRYIGDPTGHNSYISFRKDGDTQFIISPTATANTWQLTAEGSYILTTDFPENTWGYFKCMWDLSPPDRDDRIVNCVFGEDTEFNPANNLVPSSYINQNVNEIYLNNLEADMMIDYIFDIPYVPVLEIWGISPNSGTEITDLDTTLTIGYKGFDWEIYSGFIVDFRDSKIGAVALSQIFLADDLDPSGSGQVGINLQDFEFDSNGQWYLTGLGFGTHLDIEGGMFLTTRGYIDFWTDELVKVSYYLTINVEGLPTPYVFIAPDDWYSANVERFATPTALFSSFVGLISPVFENVGEFGIRTQNMFNQKEAYDRGYALGEIFPLIGGYIQKIDQFFGGFPLASFFTYLILVMFAIFIIRVVMKFIPFFG